ncbi:MAG: AbgT family transporter, partial [Candidatus Izemoplasmatales bacterium]|nr:AbgT family transporter [Candidatus Izemoplasmatales bacterium]
PRDNLKIWEFFYAPIGLLLSGDGLNVIMISLFLFILGGFFTVMDKSKGVIVIIKKLVDKYSHNKHLLIRIITLFFMLFGAFFGIFEESVALLPIMIILALSMGYDTLMAMGLTVLAAGFGFASAITNPFSVGIASEIAGINILSGVLFRVGVFVIMYFLVSTFLVNYAKKLEKNPKLSLTYTEDQEKRQNINTDFTEKVDNEQKIFKTYIIIFLVLLTLIILASLMQLIFELEIPTIVLMIVVFLFGGLLAGFIINGDMIKTLKVFWKGMLAVMPAAILIIFAGSVKYIMTSGEIMDTILYYFESILGDKPAIIGVLGIYLIILVIQFFIGSASAKAVLIMPILVPLVSLIGVSTNIAILAFIFGDGYTNVIFPTNGVLLIALSIASVSYQKWFKWTVKLQVLTFILTIILLVIAYAIGY